MTTPFALVVEDQNSLAILYEDALRLNGFNVKVIKDGLEALNYIETMIGEPKPLFIMLDMNLPRVSGRDILKHIRKRDAYDHVPVIIATANSVMANMIQPELGSNDHLMVKPISMSDLQAKAKTFKEAAKQKEDKQQNNTTTADTPSLDTSSATDAAAAETVDNNAITRPIPKIDDHTRDTQEAGVISDAKLDKNTVELDDATAEDASQIEDKPTSAPPKSENISTAESDTNQTKTPQKGGW